LYLKELQSGYLKVHFLTGNVPEETYHAQQKLQVDVLDLFRMVDQAANGALTGALPRREIQVLLRGKCPLKTSCSAEQKIAEYGVTKLYTCQAHLETEIVGVARLALLGRPSPSEARLRC